MSSATWGKGKQAFLAQKKSLAARSYDFLVVPFAGLVESMGVSMVMRLSSDWPEVSKRLSASRGRRFYLENVKAQALVGPGMREHGYQIDVAVEDDEHRPGCRCPGGRRSRACLGGEEVVFGIENVIAELAVELGRNHLGRGASRAADLVIGLVSLNRRASRSWSRKTYDRNHSCTLVSPEREGLLASKDGSRT